MRIFAATISLFLLTTPALAENVFELREGENISRLLYDRLNISTIYKNGLLQEVLKYNGLTEEAAKKLPVGAAVKLPEHIDIPSQSIAVTPEEAPVVVQEAPEEPAPEETITTEEPSALSSTNLLKWLSLGVKPATLSGEGNKTDTSYAMLLLKASAEAGLGLKTDHHEALLGVSGDFAYLKDDKALKGSNSLFLGETNLTYRYLVNSVWLGLHFNYGQRMVFVPKPAQKYELLTPWLYGIGPTIKWNNFSASYLFYPEQTVDSEVKTEMNQSFILTYEMIENNRGWKFSGAILENSTEDIDGQQLEFGARYVWYF